ncbi:tetratricopeptide repeat protein, partial [Actinacidiphila rubida]
ADVPADADDAAALYRSLLADRRVLILLDNAATPSQVRPLLPGSGGSLVIVTSRNRLAGLAIRDGARHFTLGTLPEAEAVALLRTVTSGYRTHDDDARLAELARLCAGLPLALRIAAERAASRPHMRLDDLIADLRDESALWDALSTGGEDEADTDAVRTVFAWSYRALAGPAARLFRFLGLHPAPEFSLHSAAAIADLPRTRTRQLLDDLVGAHLLEQTAPDRYQFHDLLRAYATAQARAEESPEEQRAALRRLLDWYLRTADAAGAWLRPAEGAAAAGPPPGAVAPLSFADYDAAADWSEHELMTYPRLVPAAVAAGLDGLAARLAVASWIALAPSAALADWLGSGRQGLDAAVRSGDDATRLRLLIALGTACRMAGLFDEGLDVLGSARALARSSGRRAAEGRVLNLVGLIHLLTRRLDLAADHFGQAGALFRAQEEHRLAATALSNLANTHLDAGRLAEAATAVREALAAHRGLHDRKGEGNALTIDAAVRLEQGDPAAARAAIRDALDIALALRDHRLEGFWLLTRGDVHRAYGEHGDALAAYQRSAMLHRRLGDRSREALAWRGAGRTYRETDRPEEAAAFHRRAAAVHRELNDTWELAVELCDLADALKVQDFAGAQRLRAEALTHLGPYDDPRAASLRGRVERLLA